MDTNLDYSERADGPVLIAEWGGEEEGREFQLGTRVVATHAHLRGQLFCVASGLVHVRTEHGSWLSPPQRACWIPSGVAHGVSLEGAHSGWNVLIAPSAAALLPAEACVIGVSPLLRELIARAADWGCIENLSPEQERLLAVLLDEIRAAPKQALHLPLPQDRRVLKICMSILKQPDDERSLAEWAVWAGLSTRSLSRICQQELGCSFAQWRQQARLTLALEMLAQGQAVAVVAQNLGYASPSHFISAFKRSFGASPARYFAR